MTPYCIRTLPCALSIRKQQTFVLFLHALMKEMIKQQVTFHRQVILEYYTTLATKHYRIVYDALLFIAFQKIK